MQKPIQIPEAFKAMFEPQWRYRVYYGGRGGAKCLARGTKVVMYDGSLKEVQDIKTGDLLMGIDSSARTVLSTTSGIDEMFRVRQKTAQDYVVNSQHILALERSSSAKSDFGSTSKAGNKQRPNGRYAQYGQDLSLISAEEYASKPERFKCHMFGHKRGVEFPHKDLPIEPYFLGVWLGDGHSAATAVTTADDEIREYLYDFADRWGLRVNIDRKPNNAAASYHLSKSALLKKNKLRDALRQLGVWENKHIPQSYKACSSAQRLELLAGFIDTDGTLHNNGYVVTQSRMPILRDLKFIADSLGYKTHLRRADANCNGQVFEAWDLSINGDVWNIPCKINRKIIKSQNVRKNKDWRRTRIDVEPIGSGEYYGFTINGDSLFLLEDFTVTHNSESICRALLIKGMQEPRRVLCCRELQTSIAESVHKLLTLIIEDHNLDDFYTITQTSIRGKNGTEFLFKGLRHNAKEIKSMAHIDEVFAEEAENISDASWEVLIPTIRKDGSSINVAFNTKNITDPTYKRFVATLQPDTYVKKVSWRDNPFFPDVLNKERIKLQGTDPEAYAHIWEGEPDTRRSGAVYAKQMLKAREEGRICIAPHDPATEVFTAWDLGYGDSTSIWWLQWVGRELRWLEYYENAGEQIDFYAKIIKSKPYNYSTAYLPHDGGHGNIRGLSISQQLRNLGIKNYVLDRETSTTPGIDLLRQTIGFSVFDVKKCAEGIRCLESHAYKWDEDRGIFKDTPSHDWTSHCFTGDTKVLTRNGTYQIMNLPETGEVKTLCGWKPYRNPRVTRENAQLVEVVFKGGFTVKCTPDHMFLTDSGWKSAESLTKGSLIQSSLTPLRNILKASFIGCGQKKDIMRLVVQGFIGWFGLRHLVKYLKAATSIIKTATQQIIKLIILNALTLRNILALHGIIRTGLFTFLIKRVKKLLNGTNQRLEGNGTKATRNAAKHGLNGNTKLNAVYIATRSFKHLFAIMATSINTAIQTVKPLTIERVSVIQNNENVWCLTVPDCEHFSLENGAIVHNCADSARYAAIAAPLARVGLLPKKPLKPIEFTSAGWH